MPNFVSIGSIISPIISYKLHSHPQWELIYYTSGEGTLTINDVPYSFEGGTCIAVPPGAPHYDTAPHGYTNFFVYFSDAELVGTPFRVQDTPSRDIYTLLLILHREHLLHQSNHDEIITTLFAAVFSYLKTLLSTESKNEYVESMQQMIIEHFTEQDFSMEQMYQSMHINADYARRLFVREIGTTPINFLRQMRVRHAKELLQITDTQTNMQEIALQCGFSDQYHFSKVFKQWTGASPSAWKKRHV